MESYSYTITPEDFMLFWGIREWPNKVLMATQSSMHALEEERERMIQQLDREKLAFEKVRRGRTRLCVCVVLCVHVLRVPRLVVTSMPSCLPSIAIVQ